MKYLKVLFIFTLSAAFISGCNKNSNQKGKKHPLESKLHSQKGINQKANPEPANIKSGDIVAIASSHSKLSIFAEAMIKSGVAKLLDPNGQYTVFAPSNKAFKSLPAGELKKLMSPSGKKNLAHILQYHIVEGTKTITGGEITAKTLKKKAIFESTHENRPYELSTLEGDKIRISLQNHKIYVNSAKIVSKDIKARNGWIEIINKVLMPPKK